MLKAKSFRSEPITFNSGIMLALGENRGTITHNASSPIPFGSRTVGFNRFYTAQTAGVNIAAVVVVPMHLGLATVSDTEQWQWDEFNLGVGVIYPPGYDINGLGGAELVECRFYTTGESRIFKVGQIQVKEDAAPPCLMITLEETRVAYQDSRPLEKRLASL